MAARSLRPAAQPAQTQQALVRDKPLADQHVSCKHQPSHSSQRPQSGCSASPAGETAGQLNPHAPPLSAAQPPCKADTAAPVLKHTTSRQLQADPPPSSPASSVQPMPGRRQPGRDLTAGVHDSVDQLELLPCSQEGGQDVQPSPLPAQKLPSQAPTAPRLAVEAVPETPVKAQQPAAPAQASSEPAGVSIAIDPQLLPQRACEANAASGSAAAADARTSAAAASSAALQPTQPVSSHRAGQQHQRSAARQPDMLQDLFFSFANVSSGCSSGEDEGLHVELQPASKLSVYRCQ